MQQIDEKVLALAALGQQANLVGRLAETFQNIDAELGSEDHVTKSFLAVQFRDLQPLGALNPGLVKQQIALILRVGGVGGVGVVRHTSFIAHASGLENPARDDCAGGDWSGRFGGRMWKRTRERASAPQWRQRKWNIAW